MKQFEKQKNQRLAVFPRIMREIRNDRPTIYFLDETIFSSKQSCSFKVWAPRGVVVPTTHRNKVSFPAIAAIAVIDVEGNVVACATRLKSYKTDSYVEFLKEFRAKTKGKVKLFVDNLNVHRTLKARDYCQSKGIEVIFNAIYSSEYTPIERVWLHAKNKWRKRVVEITNFSNITLLQKKIVESIETVNSRVI